MNFHGGYDPNMVGGFQVGNDAYQQQGGGRGGGRGGRGRGRGGGRSSGRGQSQSGGRGSGPKVQTKFNICLHYLSARYRSGCRDNQNCKFLHAISQTAEIPVTNSQAMRPCLAVDDASKLMITNSIDQAQRPLLSIYKLDPNVREGVTLQASIPQDEGNGYAYEIAACQGAMIWASDFYPFTTNNNITNDHVKHKSLARVEFQIIESQNPPTKLELDGANNSPFAHVCKVKSIKLINLKSLAKSGGGVAITAGDEGIIRFWLFDQGTQTFKYIPFMDLVGHGGRVNDVTYVEETDHLWSIGDDLTIRVWNIGQEANKDKNAPLPERPVIPNAHNEEITCIAKADLNSKPYNSQRGQASVYLFTADRGGCIKVWTMFGEKLCEDADSAGITSLYVLKQKNIDTALVSGLHDGSIMFRSFAMLPQNLVPIWRVKAHEGPVWHVKQAPVDSNNGDVNMGAVSTMGQDGMLKIWRVDCDIATLQ